MGPNPMQKGMLRVEINGMGRGTVESVENL